MLHTKIEAGVDIDAETLRAIDDVALEIDALRDVSARMAQSKPGAPGYIADKAYLADLVERIGSRAARIEPEPLSADALLAFANTLRRTRTGYAPAKKATTSAALHQQYTAALTAEADAQRALNAARQALMEAQRVRRAAEEAYQAHGASRLVR